MSDGKTKAHCNGCGRETNHRVLSTHTHEEKADWEGYGGTVYWEDTYESLECLGCEAFQLRHTHTFSEDEFPTTEHWPPRVSRSPRRWLADVPFEIRLLLQEVYTALHSNSRSLAVMGARALLDIILVKEVGDVGTFAKKLADLQDKGFVGTKNREYLTAMLETGNAAAHRGFRASAESVNHVMDILENLIETIYILESKAKDLEQTTPKRKKSILPPSN